MRGPAAVNALVGLRPTLPLVSRHGMSPARPSTDTIGPMTRTVRDAAILFDVMVGYDRKDPVTALGVRQIPDSYTSSLRADGLRRARVGVIREPMNGNTNPNADDYRLVRGVVDRAIARMQELGADVVDNVTIPDVIERLNTNLRRKRLRDRARDGCVSPVASECAVQITARHPALRTRGAGSGTYSDGDHRQVSRRSRIRPGAAQSGRPAPIGVHVDG